MADPLDRPDLHHEAETAAAGLPALLVAAEPCEQRREPPRCNEQRERLAVVEEQLAQMHALMTIKDQQVSAASLPPLVQEPN